ncbi:hypothetical protein GQ473_06975 [archaeon]|nr:hypothetical protein [archaeon]
MLAKSISLVLEEEIKSEKQIDKKKAEIKSLIEKRQKELTLDLIEHKKKNTSEKETRLKKIKKELQAETFKLHTQNKKDINNLQKKGMANIQFAAKLFSDTITLD